MRMPIVTAITCLAIVATPHDSPAQSPQMLRLGLRDVISAPSLRVNKRLELAPADPPHTYWKEGGIIGAGLAILVAEAAVGRYEGFGTRIGVFFAAGTLGGVPGVLIGSLFKK